METTNTDHETPEYFVKVRDKATTESEINARKERIASYLAGETIDRGEIPGAFLKDGTPKRYVARGRRFFAVLPTAGNRDDHGWAMAVRDEPTPKQAEQEARMLAQFRASL